MYFFPVVTFAALPFLVGAVPVSLKSSRTDGLFSIPLSKRSNLVDDNGFADLGKMKAGLEHTTAKFDQALNAYERNTGGPHPLALKRGHSNERRIYVPTSLQSDNNLFWKGEITVGFPGRRFAVGFETVIADTYLSGRPCPAPSCNGQNFYDISKSYTGKNVKSGVTVNFGSGRQVSGDLVSDTMSVAGYSALNQKILVATSVNNYFQFPNSTRDRMMGFGFAETSAYGGNSYFGNLINSGGPLNGTQVFAFYLTQSAGELIIGGRDSSKFSGNLIYFDVSTPGFWGGQFSSLSVNGNDTAMATREAIIDMGDLFISSNNETIANIYSKIPGSSALPSDSSGLWGVPCDTDLSIDIILCGIEFKIPSFANNLKKFPISGSADNLCVGPFASRSDPSPTMYLGTAFLSNFYIEYDQGNRKVGVAPIPDTLTSVRHL